ncbi:MAG TPA: hypothetical protein VMU18_06830 [Rhodoblastus sp.]|nr:hypothetical protein [Rhodoblastus sp.]
MLALKGKGASDREIIRAPKLIGLKARIVDDPMSERLAGAPTQPILRLKKGRLLRARRGQRRAMWRIVDPVNLGPKRDVMTIDGKNANTSMHGGHCRNRSNLLPFSTRGRLVRAPDRAKICTSRLYRCG